MENEIYYRIYAKHSSQKTFKPIDSKCNRVGNLIFAAMFTEERKEAALNELRCPQNAEWIFEARKI